MPSFIARSSDSWNGHLDRNGPRRASTPGRCLSSDAHVEPIHLHDVQAVPDAPAGQAGAEGHLAELPAGRQDRRARPQRLRQVDAAADHGRGRQGVPRRGAARARRVASACSSRSRTWTSPRTCAATSRAAWPRRARCSTASTSWPPTTPTRRPTSSPACRRRSTPPTPGTSTPSSTRRWTRCACRRADADVSKLSGGERRRVALCRLLLRAPDLLLLDEPTNHLDAESVAWLERHLEDYKGTVVAVTHDRYFLDNVAGWILELDRGHGLPFRGNYSSWLEQKQERLAQEERQESSRQRTIAARARVGAHQPQGPAHEVQGAPGQLRAPARRGAQRQARPGPDPHPRRPAARRQGDRGRRRAQGLRRPPADRGPLLRPAARRDRRRDRRQRRRQDHAVPDDRRRREAGRRRDQARRHGRPRLRRPVARRARRRTRRSGRRSPRATTTSRSATAR